MVQDYVSPVRVHKIPFEMVMANKMYKCTSKKLVEYMSLNTMFANGEFTGPLGSRKQEAQWSELKELLKELGPDKVIKFNQLNSRPRDLNQLKVQWKAMKVQARKSCSGFLKEIGKTGGGPQANTPSDADLQTRDLLNPAELMRDHNIYDSDSVVVEINMDTGEASAYERRFPCCPQIAVVVDCAVTEDSWSSDDSQRDTVRRCQLHVEAPYLLKKMIGVDHVYFIQKNHLDLKNRVLEIQATNESFSNRVDLLEECRYFVHPEIPEWTCFEQKAKLDVKNFFGLEGTVEKIAMKQYAANIAKGKQLIELFMSDLSADGVTDLKPWREGDVEANRQLRHVLCRGVEPLTPKTIEPAKAQVTDQFALDSEYIKRYLGELSPMQESRLVQLRKWIAELQKGKVPNDTTLLRFLRARDFNVEKAREMLSQSLIWRKKHQVDRILSEYETPDVVTQYFPGGWHHHDKDGRPLYVLRLGQMDVKGLLKSIGEDGLLKLTLHVCEEGLKLLEEATNNSEHAVQSWCLLVDLDGLNMRHLWRPGVRALLRIIQIVEANYPETMGRVLIVRAPRVFPILWTIVSTFIDENTRSKFLFYGGKDYLQPGGLLDYIPKDLIPDFLGGPCKSFVHEGGLVPKSLYVSGAFTERDGDPLSEDSIYRSVSLAKGQMHEVIVVNRDPHSVLTWDFDVLRHHIAFTVLWAKEEIEAPTNGNSGACVGAGGSETESVLEGRGWKEGQHYKRVEPTLVCHDGESIQGSHVMLEVGSYILQWRCELLDSAVSHRAAQLMYFYETLPSKQYKGSMSSLQSGTSGFSCLSAKSSSSCPSR